jgi:dTDP-4-dehydrorhamnose 3,5-epimerase
MNDVVKIIIGGNHIDQRGEIQFNNDFDLSCIKRFMVFHHKSIKNVRAWQGHKRENKWLMVLKGSFVINCVQIDNWLNPSKNLIPNTFILNKNNNCILHIPSGFANGFKALEKNSILLLFSDSTLEESKEDDFRFDKNLWYNWTS